MKRVRNEYKLAVKTEDVDNRSIPPYTTKSMKRLTPKQRTASCSILFNKSFRQEREGAEPCL